jgi:hypothetical protein
MIPGYDDDEGDDYLALDISLIWIPGAFGGPLIDFVYFCIYRAIDCLCICV